MLEQIEFQSLMTITFVRLDWTENLYMRIDTDSVCLLGCTDLNPGTGFSVALGNYQNQLQFQKAALGQEQSPVTLETTHGLLVRTNNDRVCQIGFRDNPSTIRIYKDIEMNNNRILFLTNPVYAHEAVSKNYVDRKFDTLSFLSYKGHIPLLECAHSKTGFIANSSSRLDNFRKGWTAFNLRSRGEWVTAGEG